MRISRARFWSPEYRCWWTFTPSGAVPASSWARSIEKLAADYEGRAKVGKVNIDEDMDLALKYGVQAVPTVVIIKNGEIYSRMVGVADKKSLTDALDGAIQD